jgi:hypothetical protein
MKNLPLSLDLQSRTLHVQGIARVLSLPGDSERLWQDRTGRSGVDTVDLGRKESKAQ